MFTRNFPIHNQSKLSQQNTIINLTRYRVKVYQYYFVHYKHSLFHQKDQPITKGNSEHLSKQIHLLTANNDGNLTENATVVTADGV